MGNNWESGRERERDSVRTGEREEVDPPAVIESFHHNGREKNRGK